MKINWLIVLSIALAQPFMLHGAELAAISAANAASSGALITIAQTPLNESQITALAQQAVANCITPQTHKYEATLQKRLSTLLTFRSQLQSESLRDKNAGLIIHQQHLNIGYIQTDNNDDTTVSSSANKQSWYSLFKNKLLIKSANEQTEVTWAHETASLLIQYWPAYNTTEAQKYRKRIESLMDNIANGVTTHIQKKTIARVPLTQDQITTIAQQAIANCMTPQTHKYEATLQKKLAALLSFRSKMQPANLRNRSAVLLINQQHLHLGCIQDNPLADTTASSSASNKKSWSGLFKSKLLIKSADEQEESLWAHETASLLVQYWPTYAAYQSQKKREYDARKQEQPYDSAEEIDELLCKNRRYNDSPIHFVPVADEQTPAFTFSELMHSNYDILDATFFPKVDDHSVVYSDIPTPTLEECFQIREHDEN